MQKDAAKRVLVTGAAGFIGYHLALYLKTRGDCVFGLDNFNAYYNPQLKKDRQKQLSLFGVDIFHADLRDRRFINRLLEEEKITHVIHLAAQAGVRHSLSQPDDYVSSNLEGFVSILEACKNIQGLKFIFASSSSVYGLNKKNPFRETDPTDHPANLYGATKKSNEVIAQAYHHLYGLSITALRYFTVYGPWGRPDMAYYRFTEQIVEGEPIQIFNEGHMRRDFTYIDDIVKGTAAAIDYGAANEIFNLGNHCPVDLLYMIELLEECLGKKAMRQMLPMQKGEVLETYADIEKGKQLLHFKPSTSLAKGLRSFVDWYLTYHPKKQTLLNLTK